MTDEEIITLAEKAYKDKPQEGCVFCDDCQLFTCSESQECVLTAYNQGFLDGFKEAMKLVKEKAAKVKEWYEDLNGDFDYEKGGKEALADLIEEIER